MSLSDLDLGCMPEESMALELNWATHSVAAFANPMVGLVSSPLFFVAQKLNVSYIVLSASGGKLDSSD